MQVLQYVSACPAEGRYRPTDRSRNDDEFITVLSRLQSKADSAMVIGSSMYIKRPTPVKPKVPAVAEMTAAPAVGVAETAAPESAETTAPAAAETTAAPAVAETTAAPAVTETTAPAVAETVTVAPAAA